MGAAKILRMLNCISASKVGDRVIVSEYGRKQREIFEGFGTEPPETGGIPLPLR